MTELLVRAEGLDVDEVSDGYVIYQTGSDRVHYLNKTAAIVFELCDGARGTDDIVSRVSWMFELGERRTAKSRPVSTHCSRRGWSYPIRSDRAHLVAPREDLHERQSCVSRGPVS